MPESLPHADKRQAELEVEVTTRLMQELCQRRSRRLPPFQPVSADTAPPGQTVRWQMKQLLLHFMSLLLSSSLVEWFRCIVTNCVHVQDMCVCRKERGLRGLTNDSMKELADFKRRRIRKSCLGSLSVIDFSIWRWSGQFGAACCL